MGDVISMGTGQVVQPDGQVIEPGGSVTEPTESDLYLNPDQVLDFLTLASSLDVAFTRSDQRIAMDKIRRHVHEWPDG